MAGNSSKKQAAGNNKILSQLYQYTTIVVVLTLLRQIVSSKISFSLVFKNFFTHLPIVLSIYIIEKTGRPHYDPITKELKHAGSQDLTNLNGNLLEILFDLVYLTWFCDIGVIVFNTWKLWWLVTFVLIPCFICYKLYTWRSFILPYLPSLRANKQRNVTTESDQNEIKSKRQLKREQNKDKIRYRNR